MWSESEDSGGIDEEGIPRFASAATVVSSGVMCYDGEAYWVCVR